MLNYIICIWICLPWYYIVCEKKYIKRFVQIQSKQYAKSTWMTYCFLWDYKLHAYYSYLYYYPMICSVKKKKKWVFESLTNFSTTSIHLERKSLWVSHLIINSTKLICSEMWHHCCNTTQISATVDSALAETIFVGKAQIHKTSVNETEIQSKFLLTKLLHKSVPLSQSWLLVSKSAKPWFSYDSEKQHYCDIA